MTVTILRRTAVHTNPSFAAPTIAFLNPSTFEVTQLRVDEGFVRLLLRQIDRRNASNGFGYIAAADVAVDSGATDTVRIATQTPARARPATVVPSRPDPVVPTRPAAVAPVRKDTTTVPSADTVRRSAAPRAADITVRPDALPPPPNGVDSPELHFLKQGPLAAILQRPISYRQLGRESR